MALVTSAASQDEKERLKAVEFFQAEFQLDHRIARLGEHATVSSTLKGADDARRALETNQQQAKETPKVFVSVMNGITSECGEPSRG